MMDGSMVFNSDLLENSLETNSSHGKLQFTELPHGVIFLGGRPGILHPSPCMNIKWNSPRGRSWGKQHRSLHTKALMQA